MYKKKFKPVITRVKLNPEQTVLACHCFSYGKNYTSSTPTYYNTGSSQVHGCYNGGKTIMNWGAQPCGGTTYPQYTPSIASETRS
jgi:hypothetical protein